MKDVQLITPSSSRKRFSSQAGGWLTANSFQRSAAKGHDNFLVPLGNQICIKGSLQNTLKEWQSCCHEGVLLSILRICISDGILFNSRYRTLTFTLHISFSLSLIPVAISCKNSANATSLGRSLGDVRWDLSCQRITQGSYFATCYGKIHQWYLSFEDRALSQCCKYDMKLARKARLQAKDDFSDDQMVLPACFLSLNAYLFKDSIQIKHSEFKYHIGLCFPLGWCPIGRWFSPSIKTFAVICASHCQPCSSTLWWRM